MLSIPVRHDILILTDDGRNQAEENREYLRPGYDEVWHQYNDVPAIFTGRYNEHGDMRVGFSFPVREDGNRVRVASYICQDCIRRVITPWEIAETMITQDGCVMDLLRSVMKRAKALNVGVGVFGATAMQAVTGYKYLHESSDLDIVLKVPSPEMLDEFIKVILEIKEKSGINIDAEVCVPMIGYVKLGELVSDQSTCIVRGSFEPKLMKRNMILEGINII